MKHLTKMLGVSAVALCAGLGVAQAQDNITIAMQLEPPHLDPTSAAAQAIDSGPTTTPTGLVRW